jgi:uncharacterized protein YbbC (DUF1343 family)
LLFVFVFSKNHKEVQVQSQTLATPVQGFGKHKRTEMDLQQEQKEKKVVVRSGLQALSDLQNGQGSLTLWSNNRNNNDNNNNKEGGVLRKFSASSSSSPFEGLGRIGLVTNQAVFCTSSSSSSSSSSSPSPSPSSAVQVILKECRKDGTGRREELVCVLGPQHGYFQTEQDNMKETPDQVLRSCSAEEEEGQQGSNEVPLFSLYSSTREPTAEQAALVDSFVVDLVDVGCRVYTYMLTLAACLRVAAKLGKKVLLLDRPNPLGLSYRRTKRSDADEGYDTGSGGDCGCVWGRVEGNTLDPISLPSFVGEYSLPMRHGLTMAELARYFISQDNLSLDLSVILADTITTTTTTAAATEGGRRRRRGKRRIEEVREYRRRESWRGSVRRQLAREWVLPSPNLPSWHSALFFPAFVTLEGTNLSEGRGTTTPFQLVGAPQLDAPGFVALLQQLQRRQQLQQRESEKETTTTCHHHDSILGVGVREHHFRPTFNKHSGVICKGLFFHWNLDNHEDAENDEEEEEQPNLFALGQHFLKYVMQSQQQQQQRLAVASSSSSTSVWFRYKDPPYEYNEVDNPLLLIMGDRRWEGYYSHFLQSNRNGTIEEKKKNDEAFEEVMLWAHQSAQHFAEQTACNHLYSN